MSVAPLDQDARGITYGNMLDNGESALGLQHPPYLSANGPVVTHRAKEEGCRNGVEGVIRKREVVGTRLN